MPWECASQVADDCVGEDLFDPPFQRGDAAICGPCARELGLSEPMAKTFDFRNGTPVEAREHADQDEEDDEEDDDA